MTFFSAIKEQRTILFLVVSFLFLLLFSEAPGVGAYWREAVSAGEYWRIFSAHFMHTTKMHLLLNWVAWSLIWGYGWTVCSSLTWLLSIMLCALGTSIGLLFFSPELQIYTGFSGLLHGLLIIVAILRILSWKSDFTAWIALLFIVSKLFYEFIYGAAPATQSLVGVPIVVEAHLYGSGSGVISVLIIVGFNHLIRVFRTRLT